MNNPTVSIIIPTYNSQKYIHACLNSIKAQTYKNIEVIIVDQESTDATVSQSKKMKARIFTLPKPKFYSPPSKSRNLGASHAQGKYLVHLDSDMELFKETIEKCVRLSEAKGFDGLVIHEIDKSEGFWGKSKALERSCYIGDSDLETARFVSKKLFEEIKGYDDKISSGEDWDIDQRYKKIGKIGDSHAYLYHNQGSISLNKQLSKKFNYGRSAITYFRKTQKTPQGMVGLMLRNYLKNWVKIAKDPTHALGFVLLRILEGGAVFLGIYYAKFANK